MALPVAAWTVFSCAPAVNANQIEGGQTTPTGSIAGQLFEVGGDAIEGATVTVMMPGVASADGGTLTTTSDGLGNFRFDGLPAINDALVRIHKDGYAEHAEIANIDLAAGSTNPKPISGGTVSIGPFSLAKLNASFRLQVFDCRGYPAANVPVQMQTFGVVGLRRGLYSSHLPAGLPSGNVSATATTDTQGYASFTNLPDPVDVMALQLTPVFGITYFLSVPGDDLDGDGIIDCRGTSGPLSPNEVIAGSYYGYPYQMSYVHFGDTPSVVFSNAGSLLSSGASGSASAQANRVGVSQPIFIQYDVPVARADVVVTDETGKVPVGAVVTITGDRQLVVVTPSSALNPGTEYNLKVHAVSAESGAERDSVGYFFTEGPSGPIAPALQSIRFKDDLSANGHLNAGETVIVTFNTPVALVGTVPFTGARLAYFNFDIDSSGTINDNVGETGYVGVGYVIAQDEPLTETGRLFDLTPSGYSTRWRISYAGAGSVNQGTAVGLEFGRTLSFGYELQSLWGAQVVTTMTTNLVLAP